ncbi:hypothetical protein DL98DRAFT_439961, partial [Cadophora sp. DSE1049]
KLLNSTDPRSTSFFQNIRKYNFALAFTFVNVRKEDCIDLKRGLIIFTTYEKIYHL